MKKIYSKIKKRNLLHIFSKKIIKTKKRIDLLDSKFPLQVSRINLKNSIVKPHINIGKYFKTKKKIQNECWIIVKGSINVTLYDLDKKKLKDIILNQGSILITIEGGHSINKSSKNAELIEIKLGPYTGKDIEYF